MNKTSYSVSHTTRNARHFRRFGKIVCKIIANIRTQGLEGKVLQKLSEINYKNNKLGSAVHQENENKFLINHEITHALKFASQV